LKTVLLVEDCESVRRLLSEFIVALNMHVLEAAGASDAILIANRCQKPIDLLITDIDLAGESGWECAEEIARLQPSCEIVFMSGSYDASQWKKPDGSYFIQKPFRLSELAKLIGTIFAQHASTL
jgi:two-component system, cell cycle sensor histidine kinase and response regulator CckA